ncbi:unnamed protein product [Brassica oleracea var. botrytis]
MRNAAAPVCSSLSMESVPPPARGNDNVQSQGLVSGDLHQLRHGKAPPRVSEVLGSSNAKCTNNLIME